MSIGTGILPALLTVSQFLAQVPIGRTTLYEQIRCGHIRSVKIGARTLIPRAEIERLIEEATGER